MLPPAPLTQLQRTLIPSTVGTARQDSPMSWPPHAWWWWCCCRWWWRYCCRACRAHPSRGSRQERGLECTPRQEAEDLQAIEDEEYRYHSATVRWASARCSRRRRPRIRKGARSRRSRRSATRRRRTTWPSCTRAGAWRPLQWTCAGRTTSTLRSRRTAAPTPCTTGHHVRPGSWRRGGGGRGGGGPPVLSGRGEEPLRGLHALAPRRWRAAAWSGTSRARKRFARLAPGVDPLHSNAHYMIGVTARCPRQLQGGGRPEAAVTELPAGSGGGGGGGGSSSSSSRSGSKSVSSAIKQERRRIQTRRVTTTRRRGGR